VLGDTLHLQAATAESEVDVLAGYFGDEDAKWVDDRLPDLYEDSPTMDDEHYDDTQFTMSTDDVAPPTGSIGFDVDNDFVDLSEILSEDENTPDIATEHQRTGSVLVVLRMLAESAAKGVLQQSTFASVHAQLPKLLSSDKVLEHQSIISTLIDSFSTELSDESLISYRDQFISGYEIQTQQSLRQLFQVDELSDTTDDTALEFCSPLTMGVLSLLNPREPDVPTEDFTMVVSKLFSMLKDTEDSWQNSLNETCRRDHQDTAPHPVKDCLHDDRTGVPLSHEVLGSLLQYGDIQLGELLPMIETPVHWEAMRLFEVMGFDAHVRDLAWGFRMVSWFITDPYQWKINAEGVAEVVENSAPEQDTPAPTLASMTGSAKSEFSTVSEATTMLEHVKSTRIQQVCSAQYLWGDHASTVEDFFFLLDHYEAPVSR
jgi:hypothetical protein